MSRHARVPACRIPHSEVIERKDGGEDVEWIDAEDRTLRLDPLTLKVVGALVTPIRSWVVTWFDAYASCDSSGRIRDELACMACARADTVAATSGQPARVVDRYELAVTGRAFEVLRRQNEMQPKGNFFHKVNNYA